MEALGYPPVTVGIVRGHVNAKRVRTAAGCGRVVVDALRTMRIPSCQQRLFCHTSTSVMLVHRTCPSLPA